MIIKIILLVLLIPACIEIIFSVIQKNNFEANKSFSDESFTISIPSIISIIGAILAIMSLVMVLCFTFLSDKNPHTLFYIISGVFIWWGAHLVAKTLSFKVIVKGDKITVYSLFNKPYSFSFDEIISAKRQVKKNKTKSERIVIKTSNSKRLIVESAEISYDRFLKRIQSDVKSEHLIGFN